jgi:hypothetical protein
VKPHIAGFTKLWQNPSGSKEKYQLAPAQQHRPAIPAHSPAILAGWLFSAILAGWLFPAIPADWLFPTIPAGLSAE